MQGFPVRWKERYLRFALIGLGVLLLTAGIAWLLQSDRPHSVTLTWNPPRPAAGITIVGYNVYRRTAESSAFIKIATGVPSPPYEDRLVSSGRTYWYVVTSIDQAKRESRFSEQVRAEIP